MLERRGIFYNRSYIAYLMKQMGLKSVLSRKFRLVTTDSNHCVLITENLLNKDFDNNCLGEKWVSDIIYIKVGSHWKYLTTILDLEDSKVVP